MIKILVYGHNGWIGGQIINLLQNLNYEFICGKSRVDDKENVENEIKTILPSHIICLVGRTHGYIDNKYYPTIDYLEQPNKLVDNVRDNLFSPVVLAILSKKYNFHLTYMGTGCIFEYFNIDGYMSLVDKNGKNTLGFDENSKPNFFGSSYSIVKGYTDELMHLFDDTVLNVRIRMPITAEKNPRNFIRKIISYENICSIPNSMSVLPELLPIMIDMLIKNITGTINLSNPGLISHNEILEMYKEIIDPLFTWKNFTIEEQNEILSAKRSNNCLDTTKLSKLYPNVKHIKDAIRITLNNMKIA